MKRTKNMIVNPTVESHELTLFTVNENSLYPFIQCYVRNLAKKQQKGIYDTNKAVDGYYTIVTNASEKYNRYFGYRFSVQERYNAAIELESFYFENVENNDF